MSALLKDNDVTRGSSSDYSGVVEHSGPLHSFLEHTTVILFPLLLVWNLLWAISGLHELELLWLIVLTLPLAMIGGDLVSGLVHWFADTYGSEDLPVIGPSFIKPFRLHHIYPRDICTHGWVETTGNVCILAVPALSISLYLMWLMPQSGLLAFSASSLALLSLATVATNQFHKWAHQESPSSFPRWLQRKRLVLGPEHHDQHHTEPFNMNYCITTGWLNPLLTRLKFFRRLEAGLRLLGMETAETQNQRASGTGSFLKINSH